MELLLLGIFFVFVLAAISAAGYFFIVRQQSSQAQGAEIPGPISLEGPLFDGAKGYLTDLFSSLGAALPISETRQRAMLKKLTYAGYRWPNALTVFYGFKMAAGLALALPIGFYTLSSRDDLASAFASFICGIGFGFMIPERLLDFRVRARNDKLRRALPAAIDLMVISIEGGQGLDTALQGAGRGLLKLYPALSGELSQVQLEMRSGKARGDALRELAERNSEGELRKFVQFLLASDRFGTSLGPTLRQHSKYLRIRFRQKAQEAARKLTVKLVFPVFFLIFPCVLLVTLGAAVMQMYKYFHSMGN